MKLAGKKTAEFRRTVNVQVMSFYIHLCKSKLVHYIKIKIWCPLKGNDGAANAHSDKELKIYRFIC